MVDWSDGYVTNLEYISGFYPGLSPVAQNFAVLFSGRAPVPLGDGFTYCELGCGHGFSTAILAAANPRGSFWGVDFNPTHIASAQQLARAGGVTNVTFAELSFAEALHSDLPRFDFISLHGVWSWISAENRKAITDFVYAKLKPGGIVYISYNAMPGQAAVAPVRQLLIESLQGQREPSLDDVNRALAFAARVRDSGAAYFKLSPHSGKRIDAIAALSHQYVAHEYFNRDWTPFYHSEVAAELARAKLVFAGSSSIDQQIDTLTVPPPGLEILKEITDPTARETIRDYYLNQQFRRDLFVRGARALTADQRNEQLFATRVALFAPPQSLPRKVRFPLGEATLEPEPHGTLIDIVAERPMTIGQLVRHPRAVALGSATALQMAVLLMAARILAPALDEEGEAERRASTQRFNAAMLSQQGAARQEHTLASPVLGTGVRVAQIDQLFLSLEAAEQRPPLEAVLKMLSERRQQVLRKGEPVAPEEAIGELERSQSEFREYRLPVYRQFGLI
jgi:SAM-dependent methyltransferase